MKNELTAKIEATRVARFKDLKPFSLAFVDSLLPDGRKRNAKVIGKGVVENPAMSAPITEDHGFTVSWILVPPGGGAGLHSHKTPEVFIPINGVLTVLIGESDQEIELQPLDVISVPTGIMRGFRNKGTTELKVLAMVGGDTGGGSVTWHADVLSRAASQTGLAIGPSGNLIKLENFKQPADIEGSTV